jgi:hypothetical protein
MSQDDANLKILSIFHYVVAGITALAACVPIIHLVVGIMFIVSPPKGFGPGAHAGPQPPFEPALFGWIFVIVASLLITFGWILAGLMVATGRCLAQRKRYMFCLIIAGIECTFMPFGTVLGVFTLVVLMRDSVKRQFNIETPLPPIETF